MDVLTKEQRSFNMSRIRSKNTEPELIMFGILKNNGLSFKKHFKITGKPDIAFPDMKIAVFINGEYWHGRHFKKNKEKMSEFWKDKISGNIKRDKRNYKLLKEQGWKVVKIWDTNVKKNAIKELTKIKKIIKKRTSEFPLAIKK